MPPVSIDPAYLAEPEDRAALRRGLRVARHLARQEPLAPWCGEELLPGPEVADEDDTALDAFLARAVITHHHPAGTCRMGPADDAGSVVDGSLRIVGLDGVAVVDASVIPRLPSGPINAAVIAPRRDLEPDGGGRAPSDLSTTTASADRRAARYRPERLYPTVAAICAAKRSASTRAPSRSE